jgi:hypothetical protein
MVLPDTLASAGRLPLVRTIASSHSGKYFCARARSEVGRKQGLFFQGTYSAILEQKTLQPLDNPFGPRVSPMS